METQAKFNDVQIENWRAFEDVRSSGAFNMYDPAAIECSGLEKEDYQFVMRNYDALKEQATASATAKA